MVSEINARQNEKTASEIEVQKKPKMPAMVWASYYVCPRGHFFDPSEHTHMYGRAWVVAHCGRCTKEDGGIEVYYDREEWSEGQRRLEAAALAINERLLGKQAKCEFCNKVIPAKNDKAYHLQKHFIVAIREEDGKFLKEVS